MKHCSLVGESVLGWAERWFQDRDRLEMSSETGRGLGGES
jgi:hypothetical protein